MILVLVLLVVMLADDVGGFRLLKLEVGRLLRLYTPLRFAVLNIPELLSLLPGPVEGACGCFGLALGSAGLVVSLLLVLAGVVEVLLGVSSLGWGALEGCSEVSCGSPCFMVRHVLLAIASTQQYGPRSW